MSKTIVLTSFLRLTVSYMRRAKSGLWYYHRRIPRDLLSHYHRKQFRRVSLQTHDEALAAIRLAKLVAADDALWETLRSPEGQQQGLTTAENRAAAHALMSKLGLVPGEGGRFPLETGSLLDAYFIKRYGNDYEVARYDEFRAQITPPESFYTPAEKEMIRLVMNGSEKARVHLSDALEAYLRTHQKGQQPKFAQDTRRAISHVTGQIGDFPMETYRKEHANAVRDHLLAAGNKTATVRRRLNTIKAVFNFALNEFDIDTKNPFERLKIAGELVDSTERIPFTIGELKNISEACKALDDDLRHIVAIQMDTGARLSEVVGLRLDDVVLDGPTPYLHFRPHARLGRTLKNKNSARKVPLVGMALWGAQRAVDAARTSGLPEGWLFPRYASDGVVKGTHASNAINKWVERFTTEKKTSHSFRHAMRDRLRHADVPGEFQDIIGGWGAATVGMGYGEGHKLEQLQDYIRRVVF